MGPICSPETSVSNHLTPRNNPEDGRIQMTLVITLGSNVIDSMQMAVSR
jgi:hypothetical protein